MKIRSDLLDGMDIREEFVPFAYSFECRLEKKEQSKIRFISFRHNYIYRSDECLESLLCCDRPVLPYAFDHRSLLLGRVDDVSNDCIVSGRISRPVPFRFDLDKTNKSIHSIQISNSQHTQIENLHDKMHLVDNRHN